MRVVNVVSSAIVLALERRKNAVDKQAGHII